MSDEIGELMKLAEEMLADARLLLSEDRKRSAISRAYYAAFNAAKAALLAAGSSPKTHAGTLGEFGQKIVNKKLVGKGTATILRDLFELRQECDYATSYQVDEAEARKAVADATEFVEVIRSALRHIPKSSAP